MCNDDVSGGLHEGAEGFLVRPSRHVLLIGEIDEWWSRRAQYALYALAADGVDKAPITIVINSDGGGVYEAHGVCDTIRTLRDQGYTVHGRVHGHAMSAAVLVLQACTTRTITQYGLLMVHGAVSARKGDAREMEAERDASTKTIEIQARIMEERTGGDWHELLRDQLPHYYTAREALEMGLVDAIE